MGDKDKSYKLLFSHAQMVEELLRDFVREDWVKLIDFSTLKKYNNSFVSDDLKERFDDVIWTVLWGKQQLYIYILIEFQSGIDYFMSVRMMTYLGLLYQDLIMSETVKTGQKLPPVLPIVLYNGTKRWENAPLDIKDTIEKSPRGLDRYLPQLRYLLIDEGYYDNHELESLKSLVSALFQLERQQTPEDVCRIITALIDWLKSPEQQSLRRAFTVWLGRVLLPSRYPGESIPEFHDLQEVHAMLSETVKSWPAQWMAKGIEKGREEGIEKGREETLAQTALRMLTEGIDSELVTKITGLSREQLEKLASDNNRVSEPAADYKPIRKTEPAKDR